MSSKKKDVARAYIRYRYKREADRNNKNSIYEQMEDIFKNKSEDARDNANKPGDKLHSYRAMVSDLACREYAFDRVVPKHLLKEQGRLIYQHDSNYLALPIPNCALINYPDMLDNGFEIAGTKIESPKSISTAMALLAQILGHVSSNTYGGLTLPDLDIHLSKYVEKSYNKHLEIARLWIIEEKREEYAWQRTAKETYDACQSLEYEIQTLTNSRAEVPFSTISFGLSDDRFGRLIQESYLKVRTQGLTGGVTPVFPKIIFVLKDGLNKLPGDRNYDIFQMAVECSSRRFYPDYISYEKCVETTGDYKSSMGCRSYLGSYINPNTGEYVTLGRFNGGVCSINLVRAAIQSNGSEEKFYEILDRALELTKEALIFRLNILKDVKAKQAPILYMSGAFARLEAEETIEKLLTSGYVSFSFGYVGLWNCIKALYGRDMCEEDMLDKAEQIMQYIRNYVDKAKNETGIGFGLYGSPAEVLATKFCRNDIKEFGIIEGVTDLGYYENSFHYKSVKEVLPFEKIDMEARFAKISAGGAIQYVEFGNMRHNLSALEEVIRYASYKTHYFGVNVRPDMCFKCGYYGEFKPKTETENDFFCPKCGNNDKSKMSIVRRTCGYISEFSERQTIDGKMKEIANRVTHMGEQ